MDPKDQPQPEATPEVDASAQAETEKDNQNTPERSFRDTMMDDIVNMHRRGELNEERAVKPEPEGKDPEPEPEPEGKDPDSKADGEEDESPDQPERPEGDPDSQDLVTVKIDGQEVQVPRDEVVRNYQKTATADKRLREAAERRKELEEIEAALREKAEQLSVVDAKGNDLGKEFAEAIFDDENKAASILNKVVGENREVKEALQLLVAREQYREVEQKEELVTYYHDTYTDIARDPDMHPSLVRRAQAISEAKPHLSPTQVLDQAADQVYERFGVAKQAAPDPEPQARTSHRPVKRTSTRPAPKPEPKPRTPLDAINEMKKARGQPAIS